MWGTFEKRLLAGTATLIWLGWMMFQTIWQIWGLGSWLQNMPTPAQTLPLHRSRHIAESFSTTIPGAFKPAKDLQNPFYPNPSQPPPAPAPVVTRQVPLSYQGFFAASSGEKRAYVQVEAKTVVGPVGTQVVAGYAISEITPGALTLTDAAGKKLTLDFRASKAIDVPIQ